MAFVRGKQPLGRDANSNRVRAAAVHTARHVSPTTTTTRKRWVVVMRWRRRRVQGMGVGNGVWVFMVWVRGGVKERKRRERRGES